MKKILRNNRGSVLIQAIVATAMIGGLSLIITNSVKTVSDSGKRAERAVAKERAAYEITNILKSSTACMNTFGTLTIIDGGSTLASATTTIKDDLDDVRYVACGAGCDATSNDSRVSSGRLRLKSVRLVDFVKATEKAKIQFNFLDERNNESGVQRSFNITTDGANNITSCFYRIADPILAVCDSLSGTLEDGVAPNEFCKSLGLGVSPGPGNSNFATEINGNLQVGNDLFVLNSLRVGNNATTSTLGTLEVNSSLPGSSSHIRETLNIGTAGTFGNEANNQTGKGQIEHSIWVGSAARPAIVAGELRTASNNDIYVQGQIDLRSILRDETFTAPQAAITAVNIGWVQRQIAESLVSNPTELDDIWDEIYAAATGGDSVTDAEELMRNDFCSRIRVNTLNAAQDGVELLSVSDSSTNCIAAMTHLTKKCSTDGNCNIVRAANSFCLGAVPDKICLTGWPGSLMRIASKCEATLNTNETVGGNYTRRVCDENKPWLIYNPGTGNCCPFRLIQ